MSETTETEPITGDEAGIVTDENGVEHVGILPADKAEADLTDAQIIARRSADIDADEATDNEHVKVFVLPPGAKPTEANGYDHRANMAATRQYAISQGLRPTGDVRHVSTKPFGPGGKSWALTYAVPCTPAERLDWDAQPLTTVVTDNETDETGTHVPNATGTAPAATGDEAPTDKSTRAEIDAYAASKGIDSTKAANKADALALITKPAE